MRLLGSLLFFLFGALLGAILGALVTGILTPQSGEQLQGRIRERIDEGRAARDSAEAETAALLKQRFRNKTGDPDALEGS